MKVDTIIVGAGSAGLSALREVRRSTDDFVLINDGHWGTTCAAVGCMPSKALIEAANAVHRRHTLEALGIRGADGLRADIPAVLARVRALRDQFVKGPSSVPDKLGKRAIAGRARLTGPGAVEVDGRRIEARAIILAPGSRPIVPEPWRAFGDRLLTSDTLFEQTDLPRRIAVIGPGAIGRRPNLAGLGLETLGVLLDDRGMPALDPETLLHEAADEGHIAGRLAAPDAPAQGLCRRTPLAITFCSAQVARVGPPLSALPEGTITGEVDFARQGRARIAAANAGLMRLHADPADGRLEHLSQRLGRRGRMSVAVARLLPVAPFPLVNLVAGTARIRLPDYLLGSALGLAPGIIVFTLFSGVLRGVLQDPDPMRLGALGLVAGGVTGFAIWLWRRFVAEVTVDDG